MEHKRGRGEETEDQSEERGTWCHIQEIKFGCFFINVKKIHFFKYVKTYLSKYVNK